MKKMLVSCVTAVALLLCIAVPAIAETVKVSTAIDCIAESVTLVKSAECGEEVSFSLADFRQALAVSSIRSVTVTSLPDAKDGVLKLSNLRVSVGQTVKAENLSLLRFVPASDVTAEASFGFICDGYSGGAEIACSILFTDRENTAPTVAGSDEASPVSTQSGVALYGTLSGSDPDGDKITYQIVSYPKNGTLSLINAETGEYRYKPVKGYVGEDSFVYVVRDDRGYYSHTKEVSLTVRRNAAGYVYADMASHTAHNEALAVSASGVMTGILENGVHRFMPEGSVTRAEFTAYALKAAGIVSLGVSETAFEDNGDIPSPLLPAVATAHILGVVNGSLTDDGLFFRPNDAVTRAEAAVILTAAFNIPVSDSILTFADEAAVPSYARPAISALSELGILSVSAENAATEPLSRGDAAAVLSAAMDYLAS